MIGDHVPYAEPGARVVAMMAAWSVAIGSLEVTLVVVFVNLVNHGMGGVIHWDPTPRVYTHPCPLPFPKRPLFEYRAANLVLILLIHTVHLETLWSLELKTPARWLLL